MGAAQAQLLAEQFGLSGRVDLYYAFILGMSQVLKPQGIAGIIVSNRFMTTKSGASVRQAVLEGFNTRHVWDLGDTKLFDAAVLPPFCWSKARMDTSLKPRLSRRSIRLPNLNKGLPLIPSPPWQGKVQLGSTTGVASMSNTASSIRVVRLMVSGASPQRR